MPPTRPPSKHLTAPHILLVNPWVHDFAAYDFWAKPLGLLTLGGILRRHGFRISYVDCLDRFHPAAPRASSRHRQGRGPYPKTPIPKPAVLADIRRTYSRYGIPVAAFKEDLCRLPRPDLVLVTSLMTYWYPGVVETIAAVKAALPGVPVILGGIYATLNTAHARAHSGADQVVTGMAEATILDLAGAATGYRPPRRFAPEDMDTWPYPALDLQRRVTYLPVLTGRGCPYACDYCASRLLNPDWRRRSPVQVAEEIRYWHDRYGVKDVAFYDDALLVDAETHLMPILERLIASGAALRFHTPNALHLRFMTRELARLMKRAGFETIRLGLETMDFSGRSHLDRKVSETEFHNAVSHLAAAGFDRSHLGAYILAGLPGQSVAEIETAIRLARAGGVAPILAHYTPIPGTPLWAAACAGSRYDLAADPVTTNNAVFPCLEEGFSWETLSRLKRLAKGE